MFLILSIQQRASLYDLLNLGGDGIFNRYYSLSKLVKLSGTIGTLLRLLLDQVFYFISHWLDFLALLNHLMY